MDFNDVEVVYSLDIYASVEYGTGPLRHTDFVTEADYNRLLKEYNELKFRIESLEE